MIEVIFMGTPTYASEILQTLLDDEDIHVKSVYTQMDKPAGRKKVLTPPPVKVLAQKNGIEVYQPSRLRDKEAIESVLAQKCDFIVVAAYGQILPKSIIDYVPCINLHASILPAYRGASPIQQSLLNGDKKTGITAMLMDEGLDSGDILKIKEVDIRDDEMADELFEKLTKVASLLTIEVLKEFDSLTPIPQDDKKVSHCPKITKADGEISFDDALMLYNKYRAFTPWPGIYLNGGLKLKKISLADKEGKNKSGEILHVKKDSIVVGCNKGSIEIFELQAPSKKPTNALSYINGKRLKVGDILI